MRCIEFRVDGTFPPKKDGANSMWGKTSERQRLIDLRLAAVAAFGVNPPFEKRISLTLEIYCDPAEIARVGDLDNFVTGVCDGLMAASLRSPKHVDWQGDEMAAIAPSKCVGIRDDKEVVEIHARKIAASVGTPSYRIALTGD